MKIQKIAVVGNIGGGKTKLSHRLAKLHGLPLYHVDSVQFLPDLKMRPNPESIALITEFEAQSSWVIDGYGPLELIENRFTRADRIVFIDLPLWQHLWWYSKRVFKNIFSQRKEMPKGCSELKFSHIKRLYKQILTMHKQMRPELIKIFARENLKDKVVFVRNKRDWRRLYLNGLPLPAARDTV
jgi:adenylate kinase family enzyme